MLCGGLIRQGLTRHVPRCRQIPTVVSKAFLHHVNTSSTKDDLAAAITECMEQARYHAPTRAAPDAVIFLSCGHYRHHADDANAGDADFAVGQKVEARWEQREMFYPGTITAKDRDDGTFSILYDDTDVEDNVENVFIRAKGKFTERLDDIAQFKGTLALGCTANRVYLGAGTPMVSLTALYLDKDKMEKVVPFSLNHAALPYVGDDEDLVRMMMDPEQHPHVIQMMTTSFAADDVSSPPARAMEEMVARIFPNSTMASIIAGRSLESPLSWIYSSAGSKGSEAAGFVLKGVKERDVKDLVRDTLSSVQPAWFTCDPNFARGVFVNDDMVNSVGVDILQGSKSLEDVHGEVSLFKLGEPLFPGQKMQFSIFEPRYRSMIHDSFMGEKHFGICTPPLSKSGDSSDMVSKTDSVGTLCKIIRMDEVNPDGSSVVVLEGLQRFCVQNEWVGQFGLSVANVDFVEDCLEADENVQEIKTLVHDMHQKLLSRVHADHLKLLMDPPGETAGPEVYSQYSFWLSAILHAPTTSKNTWYRTTSTLTRLQKISNFLKGGGAEAGDSEWQWMS